MATLINNAGVQHYANKMVLAENRKVGSKSLPTALNDIDNLIDEMKTQFDAEYGSTLDMKLENNENVFSVGTGTNIDKRSEVENSFTDVELSGNSLVNLYPKPKRENYGNITGGVSFNGEKINIRANGTYQNIFLKKGILNLKPSTTYTLIVNISKNTLVGRGSGSLFVANTSSNEPSVFSNGSTLSLNALGIYKQILTTRSSFENVVYDTRCFLKMDCTDGEIEFTYILLEGDWTNKPIPQYFEGLKSVGEKEDGNHKISISSRGKNLFNISDTPTKSVGTSFEKDKNSIVVTTTNDSTNYANVSFKIPLKPLLGKRISGSAKIEAIEGSLASAVVCSYEVTRGNYRYLTFSNTPASQTIPSNCYSDYLNVQLTNHNRAEVGVGKVKYSNIQIEINDLSTDYKSHKEDKKEISLNEPLRGLPNGVKDTIEKINGEWKIVRRCREVVFDGSQSVTGVSNLTTDDEWSKFGYELANCKDFGLVLCDTLPYQVDKRGINPDLGQYISCTNDKWKILFQIKKVNNSPSTASQVGEYMLNNPKRVIYELATPIIEDISPVTLQCWKNGTISIDEILPVETTHTVALNKPAQIKRNIEELTALRKRVQALEDFYDKVALEQSHQLSLLNNSIELDYDI